MKGADASRDAFEKAIKAGNAFAAWRLPGGEDIRHIQSAQVRQLAMLTDLLELKDGFLFCPFGINAANAFFISSDEGSKGILNSPAIPGTEEVTAEQFAESVKEAKAEIAKGPLIKVVLSRRKNLDLSPATNLFDLFIKITSNFETAFVSMLMLPDGGCWIGATPELLLDYKEGVFRSHSLAGTSYPGSGGMGEKESREQDIVTEFIKESYIQCGLGLTETENTTGQSGHLTHLLTKFTASGTFDKAPELLDVLHPTPAVGGFPRRESQLLIKRLEGQKRSLYAGFIGPYDAGKSLSLYVNLRCMWINGEKATLFSGCGITSASDPESEWKETEEKIKVLGNILGSKQ